MDYISLSKEESIFAIYTELQKYTTENIARLIYDSLTNDIFQNNIIIQIKNKNISFLQLLWFICKKYEYTRDIINEAMINFIVASFDDTTTFFEIFKWFEEFGYNDKEVSSNVTTAIYLCSFKYPIIKSYLAQIINRINNKDSVHNRTIFFIFDEVDIIKKYFTKDSNMTNRMIIRGYQYDAVNTLKQIQYTNKIKFFNMTWYMLSPSAFNTHIENSKRNPYNDADFCKAWIEHICVCYHWDYLPTMINHLTPAMWKHISVCFYMGYLNPMFVQVLFHQMKLNNIPCDKLKSNKLVFVPCTDYVPFLIENNLYHIYSTENIKGKICVPNIKISENELETTIISVPSMLVIFTEKRIDALADIIFDSTLNLSKRYVSEIAYIDKLLEDNQLGWDEKTIKIYTNFKLIMNRLLDEAANSQDLVNKYNSFIPLTNYNLPLSYQLRYVNKLLKQYKSISIKKFQIEFKMIYDSCSGLREICIKNIRKDTNRKLDPKIVFELPECPNIFEEFENLIENSDCVEYTQENHNKFWINELSDHKIIRNIVYNMLHKYYVPIQQIIPVLYKHYAYYATEEHLFLE